MVFKTLYLLKSVDEECKWLPVDAEGLISMTLQRLNVIAFWNFANLVLDTVIMEYFKKQLANENITESV